MTVFCWCHLRCNDANADADGGIQMACARVHVHWTLISKRKTGSFWIINFLDFLVAMFNRRIMFEALLKAIVSLSEVFAIFQKIKIFPTLYHANVEMTWLDSKNWLKDLTFNCKCLVEILWLRKGSIKTVVLSAYKLIKRTHWNLKIKYFKTKELLQKYLWWRNIYLNS